MARVAPEKADFRPALPSLLSAGLLPEKTMSQYLEKLKDPRWQQQRLKILERDAWTCQGCGDKTKTLHVHHLYYERGREPWEYPNSAFLTLCADCHEMETEELPLAVDHLVLALKKCGAMAHQFDDLATWFLVSGVPDVAPGSEGAIPFGVISWHARRIIKAHNDGAKEFEERYLEPMRKNWVDPE